jgi:soluble cytochrome b562
MNKPLPFPRRLGDLPERARRHFESIAIINELDNAERHATQEQFMAAARVAARAICNARYRYHRS